MILTGPVLHFAFSKSLESEADMTKHLQHLLEAAKKVVLTREEKEQQRRSFAYGNTVIENPGITRAMVDRAAEEIGPPQSIVSRPAN